MMFAKKLLIFAIFCILQHFAYLTEISKDQEIHRIKRQCGCCSCYGSGTSSCGCSPLCPCAFGANAAYANYANAYNNIGYGTNGINFNAAYDGYGISSANSYGLYGQYPAAYGNTGTGCGTGGTAGSTSCGANNMFPYSFGTGYGTGYGTGSGTGYGTGYGIGNTGYIYPQTTGCSTAFNTRCYCGSGYSPCNNGGLCCRNIGNIGTSQTKS